MGVWCVYTSTCMTEGIRECVCASACVWVWVWVGEQMCGWEWVLLHLKSPDWGESRSQEGQDVGLASVPDTCVEFPRLALLPHIRSFLPRGLEDVEFLRVGLGQEERRCGNPGILPLRLTIPILRRGTLRCHGFSLVRERERERGQDDEVHPGRRTHSFL